ncbi:hypothetical protein CDAR_186391 [Caerostris darwini]|uniref:Uncharacterized protein n=1 Tax=Caerostris darwini TaxID=1538125 RepID=A0AAV4V1G4_9ARAC|nr:hypothetical protein CDAR_186391 [Caerostris darwini]
MVITRAATVSGDKSPAPLKSPNGQPRRQRSGRKGLSPKFIAALTSNEEIKGSLLNPCFPIRFDVSVSSGASFCRWLWGLTMLSKSVYLSLRREGLNLYITCQ